jgi:hypothetical protein
VANQQPQFSIQNYQAGMLPLAFLSALQKKHLQITKQQLNKLKDLAANNINNIKRNADTGAEKPFDDRIKGEEISSPFLIAIIIKCILRSIICKPIFFYISAANETFSAIVNILHTVVTKIAIQNISYKRLSV